MEDAPTYPLGSVEPLGENSVTIDENNVVHFDIPENTGDYVYLTQRKSVGLVEGIRLAADLIAGANSQEKQMF